MAQVNLTISNVTEGQPWSAVITSSIVNLSTFNGNAQVGHQWNNASSQLTNVQLNSPSQTFNFSPSGSTLVSGGEYVTWRSSVGSGVKYPTTGWSIDLWSPTLSNNPNSTWGLMVSSNLDGLGNGVFDLNPNKWSLFYLYDSPTAFAWSKGGRLTITTT